MSEKNYADPSALGLFGLAMVTLVASSQKIGLTLGFAYIIPWAVFLGALAQFIAGLLDYKKGNTFGGTAFCAYGFFWFAVATAWLINLGAFGSILQGNVDPRQLGFAFIGYLIITLFLTVGALSTNKVLFLIFFCIDLLFIGLSVSSLCSVPAVAEAFHRLAAYAELAIALLSFYGGGANVLNNHFGRNFLPVGKPFWRPAA
ncbi:MAG: acetate uptake transporter [Clostridia bacterium]|nr:acetate uptake transporter [Clostridia bacterium]